MTIEEAKKILDEADVFVWIRDADDITVDGNMSLDQFEALYVVVTHKVIKEEYDHDNL